MQVQSLRIIKNEKKTRRKIIENHQHVGLQLQAAGRSGGEQIAGTLQGLAQRGCCGWSWWEERKMVEIPTWLVVLRCFKKLVEGKNGRFVENSHRCSPWMFFPNRRKQCENHN